MNRRYFLSNGVLMFAAPLFLSNWAVGAVPHSYKLAPESLLPIDIEKAPIEVREAYRFAIANRDTLRYIPCYCGCGEQGHTSNASCYIEDNSPPGKLIFDRMSLG
jgi:hypothetical protein